ncbi:hypothetical protein [Nocardia sp. NRRL S-836]|uniref:hypothetical protein n=1 Tax=Nocardia sp. NRRL S-836 TaxID=1519492 RepID=UPI0012FBFDBE|nr:hypothetical protein [Nocardia sp. NRRL S-836]
MKNWTRRLPEWCCYLTLPPKLADLDTPDDVFRPRGIYVHLESNANTGRPELRLLLDTDGTGGSPRSPSTSTGQPSAQPSPT